MPGVRHHHRQQHATGCAPAAMRIVPRHGAFCELTIALLLTVATLASCWWCTRAAKLAVEATTLYNKAAHTTLAFQLPAARLYQLAHRQNVIKGFYQQESRALA